jgi:hypothetical protein
LSGNFLLKTLALSSELKSYLLTVKKTTAELIKKYGLTQFDSGNILPWYNINSKLYMTGFVTLEVANVQVDTLKQKCLTLRILRQFRVRWATGGNIYYYWP